MKVYRSWNTVASLIGAAWLVGCGGAADTASATASASDRAMALSAGGNRGEGPSQGDPSMTVRLSVLSGAPQWVSGGDARIHVRAAPGLRDKLVVLLNGQPASITLKEVANGLEGVVTGLRLGDNLLEVKHRNANVRDAITLTNWPLTGPMFTGPQQTPFVCTTNQGAVGRQPLVDSATAPGYKVTDGPTVASGNTIGYSRNCSIDTVFSYWYQAASGGNLKALPVGGARPADMGQVKLSDGRTVDFIVRREVGSINRFL